MTRSYYDVVVIGGGHAGAEAAWAAANMLRREGARRTRGRDQEAGRRPACSSAGTGRVALVTMDPAKIGVMSCNPAIGGLAKGQMVREIDALGGLMGLAADATGIQFRVLNQSKGPAVRGPRCQSDKYRYAEEVRRLLETRPNLDILAGRVENFVLERGRCTGLVYLPNPAYHPTPWRRRRAGETWGDSCCSGEYFSGPDGEDPIIAPTRLNARAVVLTTGTFMRGLMHTGEQQTRGGRVGEKPAMGVSATLRKLGFELGRLKTGTPPRLDARTIDFEKLPTQRGDDPPTPFSEMTRIAETDEQEEDRDVHAEDLPRPPHPYGKVQSRFPVLEQRPCWITHTHRAVHERIAANLDRAPMYNGQIDTAGPRYCPSIEDKVVRFSDRSSHHVFLEPESLSTHEIYCNGISTSLPADVQDFIVANLPGCEHAKILRYGYAVEYDMVLPHQIDATGMTKRVPGLFLAGQINGTTGYEEAAGQGLIAGVNGVLYARSENERAGPSSAPERFRLRRDQAYIGVLMDDLVTKTPREPYRMFTSRAEHRLLLRADNADERLTPLGRELGLIDEARWAVYQRKQSALAKLREIMRDDRVAGQPMEQWVRRPEVGVEEVKRAIEKNEKQNFDEAGGRLEETVIARLLADVRYAGYIERQRKEIEKLAAQEQAPLPPDLDYASIGGLRAEAAQVLDRFRPATLGQAGRLAGVNPSDLMLVSMSMRRMAREPSPPPQTVGRA